MSDVTQILTAISGGDRQATADLFPLVYDELRRLAAHHLAVESAGQTLQPTALVHEAYVRLVGTGHDEKWDGRVHFFAAAAMAMRHILIDSARKKKRKKHGGGLKREAFDLDKIAEPQIADDLLALDEALTVLAKIEPQIAELVNLRYFGGLTIKEAAAALKIGSRTADSYWAYARAWLLARIRSQDNTST
ncbi:ECF-type sigma factor [Zavarzinella formosa]|uniref:ECF-type sigma factor n=1 Tax=Zavarzinella formosa TaxID=360055 RepID=UPI00036A70D9|nr:ECF-type sigma factor [Zavarzinella formosa]